MNFGCTQHENGLSYRWPYRAQMFKKVISILSKNVLGIKRCNEQKREKKYGAKSQPVLTCSKSTTETSEQYQKSAQS